MYCIYRITNKINGKTYIGQHKYTDLNDDYMGSGKILKQSIKKYGIENFEKEILYSRIQYKETADDMEKFAIAKERVIGKAEYNIADGGQGGNLGEEVNKKISEAMKGKKKPPISEETRKKMSVANSGRHHTEETKRKISAGNKGKHRTEEQKRHHSEVTKGKPAWNKGKSGYLSEESRKKMSEAKKGKTTWNKGKRLSEKTKRKISETLKGRHHTEETKRKMSERCHSDETRKKMSEAHKGKVAWNKGNKGILHWYNNGEISILAKECPEGFVKGRLYIRH